MKGVFEKIIEIERKAQRICNEAESEKADFSKKMVKEYEKIDKKFDEKLHDFLQEKTAQENKKADLKIEELVSSHGREITKLKLYFEENMKGWEDKIYQNIIG